MSSVIRAILLGLCLSHSISAAHLGMGLRVGEVTQDSAIVWTRVTHNLERNWTGKREPRKREPKVEKYVPAATPVENRHGAMPGKEGQVRLIYSTSRKMKEPAISGWVTVKPESDFTHQFRMKDLKSGTRYYLRIEARDSEDAAEMDHVVGSFGTAPGVDAWKDVRFAVVTGQSYWDLDDDQGYHIYPAMERLDLDFLVPTGDTVYLDSEAPRARTVELARHHWHRMYSLPRHIALHRKVPGYWEVDDHDSWVNDDWPTKEAKWMLPLTFEEGLTIFREQVPMGEKTYRTVRWGRGLQVWLVEGREFRSPNTMEDGPEKTIWGQEQMAWLKESILESDAAFRVLISPTPIVGPDRSKKADNHSNSAFAHEGNTFRSWTREEGLKNFFVCCGDRHWQYMSIDPASRLREFSCGPASDKHAGGSPKHDPNIQPFHRQKGGFLSVEVTRVKGVPTIYFRHRDVRGKVVNEFSPSS